MYIYYMYVCVYVCVCVCIYIYIYYVCIYICIYILYIIKISVCTFTDSGPNSAKHPQIFSVEFFLPRMLKYKKNGLH